MSSLWVAQDPEVENIHPCLYTGLVRDAKSGMTELEQVQSLSQRKRLESDMR